MRAGQIVFGGIICGMQEVLLCINSVFCLVAIYVNVKRARRSNPRFMLRVAAIVILIYIFCVFFFAAIGMLSQAAVALWMRWFISVVAVYFLVEAQNG